MNERLGVQLVYRMDELIELVVAYQQCARLEVRLEIADRLIEAIAGDLRCYLLSRCPAASVEDLLQCVLVAIAEALPTFRSATSRQFWAWSYRIAENKLNDALRISARERIEFRSDEIGELLEASGADEICSPAVRMDLDYALGLLDQIDEEGRKYLWSRYVLGLSFDEIADINDTTYDAARMATSRYLELAQEQVEKHESRKR